MRKRIFSCLARRFLIDSKRNNSNSTVDISKNTLPGITSVKVRISNETRWSRCPPQVMPQGAGCTFFSSMVFWPEGHNLT